MIDNTGNTSGEHKLLVYNKKEVSVCWEKLDRKSKKVTFLIFQEGSNLDEKAGVDTVERISQQIEALQFKLDQISMNIVSQTESEKVHFESKSAI